MRQSMVCVWLLVFPLFASGQGLTVVDEQDKPVEQFQVMIHTADKGYHPWKPGTGGSFDLGDISRYRYSTSTKVDLLIRAEGYASTTQSFAGQALQDLGRQGTKIALERGREVRLEFRLPSGMTFPEGFSPEVYFPDFAWRVEIMWQAENRRLQAPDFNMLGVQPASRGAGEFVFRLPRDKCEFFVGIYHPGWLRYFKAGPFKSGDFTSDQLAIDIPQPRTLTAKLDWSPANTANLSFTGVNYQLMWQRQGDSYLFAATQGDALDGTPLEVNDVAPGNYLVRAVTQPKMGDEGAGPGSINPGRFIASKKLTLRPGQTVRQSWRYVPFDPLANRGDRIARVRVLGADGAPAAGKPLKVTWYDGHYGSLTIFDGPIPADGVVTLDRISSAVHSDTPFGPYTVEAAGERLGFFRVTPKGPVQEFSFRLIPKAGDIAPDTEFLALESGAATRLTQLRGQIVYLEFWETGCGPCQPAMANLNTIMRAQAERWSGKVAVIPVCLDPEAEVIASHVKTRGWTDLRHYRSARSDGEYFADAARAFGVLAYPTSFLIDQSGKIVWRGHPSQCDLVSEVQKLQR